MAFDKAKQGGFAFDKIEAFSFHMYFFWLESRAIGHAFIEYISKIRFNYLIFFFLSVNRFMYMNRITHVQNSKRTNIEMNDSKANDIKLNTYHCDFVSANSIPKSQAFASN